MNHRPVCVKCKTEMRASNNDTIVVDYASFGPYKLWSADEYTCPICRYRIVVGFAEQPFVEHFEINFKDHLDRSNSSGNLIKNYEFVD